MEPISDSTHFTAESRTAQPEPVRLMLSRPKSANQGKQVTEEQIGRGRNKGGLSDLRCSQEAEP